MAGNTEKKAAFLVRCSTNKQDLDRQIQDLQVIADRFGFTLYKVFGEHITGKDDTTKRDRRSIIESRAAAERHEYDVLLVAEVSRMSRDSVSGRVYVRQFRNLGIPIYFRDKMKWTINPETMKVDESFEKELGLYFDGAAEYLKSMKTQIASGRRMRLSNNEQVVGQPYIGYKRRGGNDKYTKNQVVIDDDVAPMVRDVFRLYLEEGATLKSVALAVTAKYRDTLASRTINGIQPFRKSVSGVQQILANESYYTGKRTILMTDPDNKDKAPEPFELTFDPLIDKETFDKATRKRDRQRSSRVPYPKQQIHPLTKLIRCPFCNRSFSPRPRSGDHGEKYRIINGKIAFAWLCMTRINNAGNCNSHVNLNGEKVETIIWDFIKKELLNFADLNKDTRADKIYELNRRIDDAKGRIPLYETEITKLDQKASKAFKAYVDAPQEVSDMAQAHYNATMLEVKRDKENYKSEITRLKDSIESWEASIEYYSQTQITDEFIAKIEDNDDEKRKLFVQLIEKIVPYGITPGVVVMETHTINGVFYILHNGHTVGKNRIAYYIAAPFAVWHQSSDELQRNEVDSYFSLKNVDILEGSEIIANPEHVTFKELIPLCKANGWELPYNYIYERIINSNNTQVI